jgi:hypothetical protein
MATGAPDASAGTRRGSNPCHASKGVGSSGATCGSKFFLWALELVTQRSGWRGKKTKLPDALDDLSPGHAVLGLTGDEWASVASGDVVMRKNA